MESREDSRKMVAPSTSPSQARHTGNQGYPLLSRAGAEAFSYKECRLLASEHRSCAVR